MSDRCLFLTSRDVMSMSFIRASHFLLHRHDPNDLSDFALGIVGINTAVTHTSEGRVRPREGGRTPRLR